MKGRRANRTIWLIIASAALILSALSCSEPDSTEQFIFNKDGTYSFTVDMSRANCAYDFSFYSRVDARHKVKEFPIDVYGLRLPEEGIRRGFTSYVNPTTGYRTGQESSRRKTGYGSLMPRLTPRASEALD